MANDKIIVKGANEHNLKNINLKIILEDDEIVITDDYCPVDALIPQM